METKLKPKPKKKTDKCQCGEKDIETRHDFYADMNTGINHTREKCTKFSGGLAGNWGN